MRHSPSRFSPARVLVSASLFALACLAAGASHAHPMLEGAAPPAHARLGVQLQPMTPELREFMHAPSDRGVLVVRVDEDSAAEKAGLRVGDVIVAVNGEPATDTREVVHQVMGADENAKLALEVSREGKTRSVTAALVGKPAEAFPELPFSWFQRGMPPGGPELDKRLDEIERRLEELEQRLEKNAAPAKPERTT